MAPAKKVSKRRKVSDISVEDDLLLDDAVTKMDDLGEELDFHDEMMMRYYLQKLRDIHEADNDVAIMEERQSNINTEGGTKGRDTLVQRAVGRTLAGGTTNLSNVDLGELLPLIKAVANEAGLPSNMEISELSYLNLEAASLISSAEKSYADFIEQSRKLDEEILELRSRLSSSHSERS